MTDDQVLFGWNPDLDIPSAIQLAARDLVGRGHVLISMVDSTPRVADLPSLSPLLTDLGAEFHVVDGDISVTFETLLTLIDRGFFNGFDEVWLFRDPPANSKPPSLRLTSDVPLGTESVSYTHLRAHETVLDLVCRLLLEK